MVQENAQISGIMITDKIINHEKNMVVGYNFYDIKNTQLTWSGFLETPLSMENEEEMKIIDSSNPVYMDFTDGLGNINVPDGLEQRIESVDGFIIYDPCKHQL